MTRDAILEALGHFGYSRVETGFEEPAHPHGPAFSLVALR
jgi:hypothetical protein